MTFNNKSISDKRYNLIFNAIIDNDNLEVMIKGKYIEISYNSNLKKITTNPKVEYRLFISAFEKALRDRECDECIG